MHITCKWQFSRYIKILFCKVTSIYSCREINIVQSTLSASERWWSRSIKQQTIQVLKYNALKWSTSLVVILAFISLKLISQKVKVTLFAPQVDKPILVEEELKILEREWEEQIKDKKSNSKRERKKDKEVEKNTINKRYLSEETHSLYVTWKHVSV